MMGLNTKYQRLGDDDGCDNASTASTANVVVILDDIDLLLKKGEEEEDDESVDVDGLDAGLNGVSIKNTSPEVVEELTKIDDGDDEENGNAGANDSKGHGKNADDGACASIAASSTDFAARRAHFEMLQKKKNLKERRRELKQNRAALSQKKGLKKLVPTWMPGSELMEAKHIRSHRRKSVEVWELMAKQEQLELQEEENAGAAADVENAGNNHNAITEHRNSVGAVTNTSASGSQAGSTNKQSASMIRRSNSSSSLGASTAVSRRSSITAMSRRSMASSKLMQGKLLGPLKSLNCRSRSRSRSRGRHSRSRSCDTATTKSTSGRSSSEPSSSSNNGTTNKSTLIRDLEKECHHLKRVNERLLNENKELVSSVTDLKEDNEYLAVELETLKREHTALKETVLAAVAQQSQPKTTAEGVDDDGSSSLSMTNVNKQPFQNNSVHESSSDDDETILIRQNSSSSSSSTLQQ